MNNDRRDWLIRVVHALAWSHLGLPKARQRLQELLAEGFSKGWCPSSREYR